MSPSLKVATRGGEYDAKMCGLCRWYLWGGRFPPARINHDTRNRTDLALRPKITGNNTTLVSRQEMYHHIALISFLCLFPSWAYGWRWCHCCHLLVSIIRVRYVASGMYVINSTKKLKTVVGFDGNLFPGQIPRRVFNSGRWEMLQTFSMSSIRKTIHNM